LQLLREIQPSARYGDDTGIAFGTQKEENQGLPDPLAPSLEIKRENFFFMVI
jgi:hypothetical protein